MKFGLAFIIAICALRTIAAAEVWEGKKYENYESNNFNDYMIELGVGFFTRQILNSVTPTVELKKVSADEYELRTTSSFKDSIIRFKLGQDFDETTLDDRHVKSVITLEGDKFIHKVGGNPKSEIIRVFSDKEMIATMKVNGVFALRKYKAV